MQRLALCLEYVALAACCLTLSSDAALSRASQGGGRLVLRGSASRTSRNATATGSSQLKVRAQQNATSKATRPPKVYFLFLAVDKVSNLGVWKSFFGQAPPSQYMAYVHCKLPACTSMVSGSPLIPVPTVPSYYCTDLVSPMNQLLAYALSNDGSSTNPADKFAFVSDSTLPAKPFSQIYSTLTMRHGSDFCAFPSNEWADIPGNGGLEVAVKTHQWIVLERVHAEKASIMWASGKLHNFMTHFQMNSKQYSWNNNSFADSRNFGCLDEFWHMAALYGTLNHVDATGDSDVSLSLFTNAPLRVSARAGWQGSCDTFVIWSKYLHIAGQNPFLQLHSALDPASIPHGGNFQRPGWWDTISLHGIQAIRNSGFLFVRKFIDNPYLASGGNFGTEYARIVLS
mmetsp:Transcript_17732/g.31651  ORF Transcript_17732/g.31651 Transcript_17732/m.31651 type:complete len:399 (+) Transcript_17732:81-1277(+)